MAVPKNKRYRQVVRIRRSLQKLNLILKKNLALTKLPPFTDWKYITDPFIKTKDDNAVTNGQGLGSTKWKKCLW